jgi:hypothetical protein
MKQLLFVAFLGLVYGCSLKSENDRFYKESAAIHFAMVAKANEMKTQLNDFKVKSPDLISSDSLTALLLALEQWEQDLVEVPGYDHNEDGSEHHHELPPEVTAQQMLHIQQALELRLIEIRKRLERLIPDNETI